MGKEEEMVKLLLDRGFTVQQIADLLNLKPAVVAVYLSRLQKRGVVLLRKKINSERGRPSYEYQISKDGLKPFLEMEAKKLRERLRIIEEALEKIERG